MPEVGTAATLRTNLSCDYDFAGAVGRYLRRFFANKTKKTANILIKLEIQTPLADLDHSFTIVFVKFTTYAFAHLINIALQIILNE